MICTSILIMFQIKKTVIILSSKFYLNKNKHTSFNKNNIKTFYNKTYILYYDLRTFYITYNI